MSKEDVAAKYSTPKNTLSIQIKNKEKLLVSLEKGGKATFKWFLSMRSQNLPLSAAMIQEKAFCHDSREGIHIFQKIKC